MFAGMLAVAIDDQTVEARGAAAFEQPLYARLVGSKAG